MDDFYLNKNEQPNGDHEVHRSNCYWLPSLINREYLGRFTSSFTAILQARATHVTWRINGCAHCCPESHTT